MAYSICVAPEGGWMQRELLEKPLYPGAVCNVRFPHDLGGSLREGEESTFVFDSRCALSYPKPGPL